MNHKIISLAVVTIVAGGMSSAAVLAQTKEPVPSNNSPALNLDDAAIVKEISAAMPVEKSTGVLSAEQDKLGKSIEKSARYRGATKMEEIFEQGSTDRVEKITSLFGIEYCVYLPTQGRTDGIDSIKDGMQYQVRTCPHYF